MGVECRPRNLRPIVHNENEPATKKDLAELAVDLADLTGRLTAMEERLVREMWHVANVVIEQIGAKFAAIAANPVGHRRSYRVHETALGQRAGARVRPASVVTRRA